MRRSNKADIACALVGLVTSVGCAPAEPHVASTEPRTETTKPLDATARELLAAHNDARRRVGVAALVWSDALAQTARRWATKLADDGCSLQHNSDDAYGENLYWTSAPNSAAEVVASWTSESQHFDARSKTCANGQVCGHYTQVVWSGTTTLGCGMARCGSAQVWVCNYDPPGNWAGQKPF